MCAKRPKKRIGKLDRAAFHEAGHAVVAHSLRLKFSQASILQSSESGAIGHVPFELDTSSLRDGPVSYGERRAEKRLEHRIVVLGAGVVAVGILTGRRAWRGEEIDEAKRLAQQRCSSGEEIDAFLKWLLVRTENELRLAPWWRMVEALAAELIDRDRLSGQEAVWVMQRAVAVP